MANASAAAVRTRGLAIMAAFFMSGVAGGPPAPPPLSFVPSLSSRGGRVPVPMGKVPLVMLDMLMVVAMIIFFSYFCVLCALIRFDFLGSASLGQ